MVLPGSGQSFDQFRYDDGICQDFASTHVGGATANDSAVNSEVGSAVLGTVLGAALGAAIGGGGGGAIGAGSGLLAGSVMGVGAAGSSGNATQQRYDAAYLQCMYAKGHQVPGSAPISSQRYYQADNPTIAIPPPPPPNMLPPSP